MSLEKLKVQLNQKKVRVNKRYSFYEMKNVALDFGISTPPSLKHLQAVLGWCAKAVDSLADRLQFSGFADDNFGLSGIYDLNNRDILFGSAVLSALIASCCFIYISEDEAGFPRLQVIDGGNATGDIDPITGLLKEGYAVLEYDEFKQVSKEAYFTADFTAIYDKEKLSAVYPNKAPYPLLVPIIFRPDAKRPFGHSRISRACMSIMSEAMRTIKRSEISAEFYSFPQRWVTGIDQNADEMDKWKATMSSLLKFTVNDDGDDKVKLGQFTQQNMEPHVSQLKMFASLFSGETGLTLDDLGFPSENPSSAEAIKATHENLRLTASRAQQTFGSGFLNAGYLAACVRDNFPYKRNVLYMTRPKWLPVFEPDASMLGAIGDGLSKLQTAFPGYIQEEHIKDLVGF